VSIVAPIHESGYTYVQWSDVAEQAGWISLAIVSHPRNPPGFTEVSVVARDLPWDDIVYWFDFTDHDRDRPAYSMSVSTLVDTSHNYACQAWIEASAYAQNGQSRASSHVTATVGSFTYTFV
jgi:hypothetical protein